MKYVLIMIISSIGAGGWTSTEVKQEFKTLDECKMVYMTWKLSLGAKLLGGDCARL